MNVNKNGDVYSFDVQYQLNTIKRMSTHPQHDQMIEYASLMNNGAVVAPRMVGDKIISYDLIMKEIRG